MIKLAEAKAGAQISARTSQRPKNGLHSNTYMDLPAAITKDAVEISQYLCGTASWPCVPPIEARDMTSASNLVKDTVDLRAYD
jgi:hypothetical protein